ncbi:PSD1 and planctomycete cytochrome C domain-containing protein [Thalassoroseus pseudoceratinae]|uniref:PSD1 and planctomycete cytochrome C domain-containing protein n=1 Tax=Thalassoroseus pseudoceratinae TaxID=2713176 RepID=UPI00197ED4C8|nr:PSD1 and planctomycete cytochrome C domain-containing protein [Thalassoroseus pseudoceratinae]
MTNFPTLLTLVLASGVFGLVGPKSVHADEQAATAQQLEFFEKEVRPLLAKHCYQCHSADAKRVEGSLLLDRREAHLRGGDSGAAIVPGDADNSLLIEAVRYESYEMPPKGKLPDREIEILVRWINMGAPWPDEPAPTAEATIEEFDLAQRKAEFWVWQPITDPKAPLVQQDNWPRNNIDRFILARLEEAGLRPSGDADRTALLRRLYFDLIGLPPTPAQVQSFLADESDGAVEKVVDELLSSPHFGERWARHWLDLVRYAESRGHEFDNDTPNAFQYRDYVIRALNADVPYDQFVREHIAGDLLPKPRLHPTEKFNESVLGTGFWHLGEWVHSPVDVRKDEADRFDNMLDVMSKTFLGVTVACARCHDHKFDAISTADYYSLTGFLQSSDYRQVRFETAAHNRRLAERLAEVDAKYQRQIAKFLDNQGISRPKQTSYLDDEAIVVDYGTIPQTEFRQDGFIFGSSPRREGFAYPTAQSGSVEIAKFASAVNDPIWSGLESITAGSVHNRSTIAKLPKSGRTLRSPTFELKDGAVSCLVEGEGHVFACVDSHRLVAGPLHKETIRPIKPGTHWVNLNLSRYVGHRIHLEFVPAKNAQLSVRMITQGLDAAGRAEIDRKLTVLDKPHVEYAQAAEAVLNSKVQVEERIFADFESGNYDGWTATGEAFGAIPQTLETIAPYQGRINGRGKYFVNSHNIRPGGDVRKGDRLTGTLTSTEFTIDFDTIEFLVGGGSHQGKTCVNLVIDDEVELTATGRNNNQMSVHRWDVRPYQGKKAMIQVVDNHQGGWGNIGVDHIVFQKADSETKGSVVANRILRAWTDEREKISRQILRKSHVAPAMMDGTGEDAHIFIRGNSSKPGDIEPRHFLTAISGDEPLEIESGSGRLKLARLINAPTNPLTSRVIVNRIWHHLMGRGIVPTVDDFGFLGQRPTHPKLLDHLATRLRKDGQSLKQMIKYVVLSRAYQMSSHADPHAIAADPKNQLWHYRPPQRLEGEVIRDSLLALSGRLDETQFGPPIPIHLTPFMDGRGRPNQSGPLDGAGRRSIYIAVRRNFLSPMMLTFDTPNPFSSMGRRNVSNVPAQALILLNDPLVVELSREWGQRALEQTAGASEDAAAQRINWLYLSGFGRYPTTQERETALNFLQSQAAERNVTPDDSDLWADLAHVLVNTKEFIFLR